MEQLILYAKHLNANTEVLHWLNTTGKKALAQQKTTASELEHILDFLVSSHAPSRLQKMSFADAKRKTSEWTKQQQKKGENLIDSKKDIELIHDFFDGTRIVRLKTKKALQREGFLMSHCVGSYSVDDPNQHIYSYRDKNNMPHATFEVQKENNEIMQIKGKGNGMIHPKYVHPILAFLKAIGMDIRPQDMVNLGYYHIDKVHLDFINKFESAKKQYVTIYGEAYAF